MRRRAAGPLLAAVVLTLAVAEEATATAVLVPPPPAVVPGHIGAILGQVAEPLRGPKPVASLDGDPLGMGARMVNALPQSATWLMMILGFFGLSFAVRRREPGGGTRVRFN